ncbi:MAG TPA: bifunctional 4'-phosphopantothenoylcysteine decarboxylase/phosphopantothenoylcysteine synthetase, partial [Gammaproteobacteria bacterium]|nr:bifunctional 4'-phosphopantothenoylcysteine decarboxylase/phosphopantothenoylcysteine synthetase [Gammaproteobacteria bacterium]
RHARDKLASKGVDMMAANLVGPSCGFDQETNALTVLWEGGGLELEKAPKAVLAQRLIAVIAERYRASRGARGAAPQASPAS